MGTKIKVTRATRCQGALYKEGGKYEVAPHIAYALHEEGACDIVDGPAYPLNTGNSTSLVNGFPTMSVPEIMLAIPSVDEKAKKILDMADEEAAGAIKGTDFNGQLPCMAIIARFLGKEKLAYAICAELKRTRG